MRMVAGEMDHSSNSDVENMGCPIEGGRDLFVVGC